MKNGEVLNRLEINGKNNRSKTHNPAKNELGHISKAILDTANKNMRSHGFESMEKHRYND